MQDDGRSSARAAVPRWRSLTKTSEAELRSSKRPLVDNVAPRFLASALARWESQPTLENAVDVVDAAATGRNHERATAAALQIIENRSVQFPSLIEAARRILGQHDPEREIEISAQEGKPHHDVVAAIRRLKTRLRTDPRDALSAIEVGRLQTLSGQSTSAKKYVNLALKLAPNNRYVLRCASRYFTFVRDPEQGLAALQRSQAVRQDAWVQAAEVAVADLAGRTPKWGTQSRNALAASDGVGVGSSELALGLATLEFNAGGKRKLVRKLAEHGLAHPTENALAQAVWLEDKAGIEVTADQKLIHRPDANEALAMRKYVEKSYSDCLFNAWKWVNDQPFSPRGYLLGASCASIHLNDHNGALALCNAGLKIHHDNRLLLNGLMVAQAYLGRINDALSTLGKMEALRPDAYFRSFISAGKGLILYRQGRVREGRLHYLKAMDIASSSNKPNLAVNALIYWLEQEAKAGVMSLEDWSYFKKQVLARIDKLSSGRRFGIKRIWEARCMQIDDLYAQVPLYPAPGPNDLPATSTVALPFR